MLKCEQKGPNRRDGTRNQFINDFESGREELQPAKPSKGCVRQNGYFPHPDTCEKYNYCVNGAGNTVPCAGGLIFDPNKGVCDYPDQVERKEECLKMKTKDAEDGEFQCPQNSSPFVHTRHPDPEGKDNYH